MGQKGGRRVDPAQPIQDPTLTQAMDSASEWNSLLMTARAERGPQWDVGTQQFLVDHGSDLYYDATPLLEVQQKLRSDSPSLSRRSAAAKPPHDAFSPMSHPHHPHQAQSSPHRSHSQGPGPGQGGYYSGSPTSRYPPQGGFGAMAPGQFYNGRDAGSPARMMGQHDTMASVGRRVTRGSMADDAYHPGM
ncbi:hypothetical protein FIBSPDRAFT_857983 [Athelia psychrophila]|uniref:Uncharacterized protein n=1 Tax=Athelia psychrophila TaxID=1759441 RepID=A0A166MBJ5_9AGAM|nr:hypothetical protein FIBSPDRAFT_857979 [Fibularhizoctonia sp. CBS 109695]KZP23834.1 hypothetical protein FIBSPDRAFT_857983 [Fibularhizoctonia sp. CBS 109695]